MVQARFHCEGDWQKMFCSREAVHTLKVRMHVCSRHAPWPLISSCVRTVLQILEKRLKHHEEQAIRKYYELDHQLRKDPRLSALVQ